MDTEGQVFGQPDQVEIDVVIHDGDYWLLELKSSISRGDVSLFRRKVAFYEREEAVEVRRSILISPHNLNGFHHRRAYVFLLIVSW